MINLHWPYGMAGPSHTPFWDEIALPSFPRLDRSLSADVVVIGGGITGITAARLLTDAGCRVALLERDRVGGVDTRATTAHLAAVVDARLDDLASRVGKDHAQAVWDAGWAAIAQIDALVQTFDIACDFAWCDGFLHVAHDADAETARAESRRLAQEAALAQEMGFDADHVAQVPLIGTAGMRVRHQARFHPRKYLAGLLASLSRDNVAIFEHSRAEVTDEGVTVGSHRMTAPWVVLATHNPLQGRQGFLKASVLQTRLALYNSYVVRAALEEPREHALFWDTHEPYRYLRIDTVDGRSFAIAGGADHKTGQADRPAECYETVEAWLARVLPDARVTERWSGQVIETPDGLPIIGTVADKQFVATGFAGNGMTFGTLSAMMARDAVTGAKNPWRELFSPTRSPEFRGPWTYLTENADYPYYMIRDQFAGTPTRPLRAIGRDAGALVEIGGRTVAVYRHANGKLVTLDPTCTHLGCRIGWNAAERLWECPCHGSRFRPGGDVLAGPAEDPLARVDVKKS